MAASGVMRNRFDHIGLKLLLAASILLAGAMLLFGVASFFETLSPSVLLPPPTLIYISGAAERSDSVGYRYHPYCWLRHYYADNPRNYFQAATSADRQLSGWSFNGSKESTFRIFPSAESTFPLLARVDANIADGPAWSTTARHTKLLYPAGSKATLTIKGHSEVPRRIEVLFWPPDDWNHPFVSVPIDFDSSSKVNVIELPETKQDLTLLPGLNLGGGSGEFRIDDLSLEGFESLDPERTGPFFVEYKINKDGYRGKDWSQENSPGTLRIACIGDSFTFGQGVKEFDLFTHVLEKDLNSRNGQRYEVLNFGMMGYSTNEEIVLLHEDVSRFSPHVVVLTMCLNDPISFKRENDIAKSVDRAADPAGYQKALDEIIRSEGYKDCVERILNANTYCKEHHCSLVVGIFNVCEGWEWDMMLEEIIPVMKGNHIPSFDVKNELVAAGCYGDDGFVHECDRHPNEKAHAIYARKLQAVLEKEVFPRIEKVAPRW